MKIRRCRECGVYTFREACPSCGLATGSPHPPRFSPQDRYGAYRRKLKMELMERDKDA